MDKFQLGVLFTGLDLQGHSKLALFLLLATQRLEDLKILLYRFVGPLFAFKDLTLGYDCLFEFTDELWVVLSQVQIGVLQINDALFYVVLTIVNLD